ncbi:VanZ family protein [Heyndrickxia sporothermodurans]|uniref:VanZ family protein n=1 Tax=Bacilli TaxID=91061 RepID=UPI0012E1BFA3|nr:MULTISPECIES: VanZ family protein [Bacilli]MEB6551427.1 VanZ family protein [Heyndrickxia sporothermodurans]QGU39456.1 VanZ family protein [Streptococcus mutans]
MVIFFNGWILYSFIVLYFISIFFLKFVLHKNYIYLLFFSIMYIYLYNVINITQFPIYVDELQRETFGGQNVWKDMNLIPFKDIFNMTSLLNIVMTIPLGFGLPFLIKANIKKITFWGFLSGFLLETMQLLAALYAGYTFRVVDINDLIFNWLGTLIGYLIFFKLFIYLFNYLVDKFKIKHNSIVNYISNI